MFGARQGGWHSTPVWRDLLLSPLCPSTFPLCLHEVLHSVLESQLLVVIMSVCVTLSTSGCACVHTHACICPLHPPWGQDVTCGPQSYLLQPQCLRLRERRCTRMPAPPGCRASAVLTLRSAGPLPGFAESGSALGGMAAGTRVGRGRGGFAFESLESFLGERIRQGCSWDLHSQAIHSKEPWDTRTKDGALIPNCRHMQLFSFSTSSCSLCWVPRESVLLAVASLGSRGVSLCAGGGGCMCARTRMYVCTPACLSAYQVPFLLNLVQGDIQWDPQGRTA